MLLEAKTKKLQTFKFGAVTVLQPRDGQLPMLTKPRNHRPRDSMPNPDSTVTDHSTSNQDFHSVEL